MIYNSKRYDLLEYIDQHHKVFLAYDKFKEPHTVIYKITNRNEFTIVSYILQKNPEIIPDIRDKWHNKSDNIGYIVMELCSYDLNKAIKSSIVFDKKTVIKNIVENVSKLHNIGVFHRDLKPANIVSSTSIKLIDFETSTRSEIITGIVGTPEYIAPEVILGEYYPKFSDVWTLGICIYFIVTGGKTPWDIQSPSSKQRILMKNLFVKLGKYKSADLLAQIATTHQIFIPTTINMDLADLLSRMLQFNPKKRIDINRVLMHIYFKN